MSGWRCWSSCCCVKIHAEKQFELLLNQFKDLLSAFWKLFSKLSCRRHTFIFCFVCAAVCLTKPTKTNECKSRFRARTVKCVCVCVVDGTWWSSSCVTVSPGLYPTTSSWLEFRYSRSTWSYAFNLKCKTGYTSNTNIFLFDWGSDVCCK